jgi:negative regulator of sigma E activity
MPKCRAQDYPLFPDGIAGVIETKREGETLTGVEIQSQQYSEGAHNGGPCQRRTDF